MVFRVDQHIHTVPETAFDAMADARNEVRWNNQVTRVDLISPEPIGVGTRFKTVNRGAEYDTVIADFSRPSRLEFEVQGKPMVIRVTLEFMPAGAGRTRLLGTFDMQPRGFMKLIFPLMAPLVRRDFPKQMSRFKDFCERGPSSA